MKKTLIKKMLIRRTFFFYGAILIILSGLINYSNANFRHNDRLIIPESVKASVQQRALRILFVGDIMPGRHVETLMDQYGMDYPFQKIDPLLNQVNLVIANLEGPIQQNHIHTPDFSMHFSFYPDIGSLLTRHNISLVSVANNHTFDMGNIGYEQTLSFLDKAGVLHVGHPLSVNNQSSVINININDQRVIVVAFNIVNPTFDFMAALDLIKKTKKQNNGLVAVMIHGGDEYAVSANQLQSTFYHQLIDAGADVIIGAHPHVVQNIEVYNKKIIFYSLGNFIFDQYFSSDVQQELGVSLTLDKDKAIYSLIPIVSLNSQPHVMSLQEQRTFLQALANRSQPEIKREIASGLIQITR